jgi:hypothetical protein
VTKRGAKNIKRAQMVLNVIGSDSEKYSNFNENFNDTLMKTSEYSSYLNKNLFNDLNNGETALFLIAGYLFTQNFGITTTTSDFFKLVDEFRND